MITDFIAVTIILGYLFLSISLAYDNSKRNKRIEHKLDRLQSWRKRQSIWLYKRLRGLDADVDLAGLTFKDFIERVYEQHRRDIASTFDKVDRSVRDLQKADDRERSKNANSFFSINASLHLVIDNTEKLKKEMLDNLKLQYDYISGNTKDIKKAKTRVDHIATIVNGVNKVLSSKSGKEIVEDLRKKNRGWRGVWKITDKQKFQIVKAKGTLIEIAKKFGISRSRVGQIKQEYNK